MHQYFFVLRQDRIQPLDCLSRLVRIRGIFVGDGQPVDLVVSDMAPNMSGMTAVDQPRAMYLVELALDLARRDLSRLHADIIPPRTSWRSNAYHH